MSIPGRRKGIHGNGRGDGITLSDIIRGLQHCVNSSQEIVEQHHIRGLDRFFDADGRPYSTTVRINDSAFMDIPHLCMSGHSSLILDELEVKLELMLRKTALKSNVDEIYGPNAPDQNTVPETGQSRKGRREEGDSKKKDGGRKGSEGHVTRSSFGVDLSNARGPDRRHAQLGISMKFKSTNTPEMLCRLVDKINNATDAYPVKEDKQAQNEVDEG